MENFKQITAFSYDILNISFAIGALIVFIISAIVYQKVGKKNKNKDVGVRFFDFMFYTLIIIFSVLVVTMSTNSFKEHAIYEGRFKVVQSNTNEILANNSNIHQIKLEDKQGNIQEFNIDDNTKYKKGDIAKVKIKVQKGVKPSLKKEISTNDQQINYQQLLVSINNK